MTSIQNQSLAPGLSARQNALSDARFSSYVRKQSLNAYESLDAGLTIQTKEGDIVTLTSNTYSEFDAFMYNSKGVLQTESGKAAVMQNQREITLTSGESFSFSVAGDLSEEELKDIEAIVKGIDEVISKMAQGDMDGAVANALSMGGYDTVSMYSADITYQKSYTMTSETRTETVKTAPETQILPKEENNPLPSVREPFPENHSPQKKKNNSIKNINQFVEKMAKALENHDEKLVDKARKPVDKLFKHHLKELKTNHKGRETSTYNAVEDAGRQVNKLIDQMTGKMFKNCFSALME
jgi:hypothetical protein